MLFRSSLNCFIVFSLISLVLFHGQAVLGSDQNSTTGTPWVGQAGIQHRAGDIPEKVGHGRQVGRIQLVHKLADAEYPETTQTPVLPVEAINGEVALAGTVAQTVGSTFLGATLADCQAYPPDTMGAVGPSQFIVAVNGRIRSFNKSTGVADGAVNADTDAFFASVMTPPVNNNFTSDPRIRYDRLSRRWFIIMIDVPGRAGSLPNRVMIAVSDGPVVTSLSSWTFYQFQHDLVSPAGNTGQFADYPTLGIDASALYIGVNLFTAAGSFANTTAFVVRKSSLLNGGPIVVTAFRNLIPNGNSGGPFTPQGVDNFDPNATEGYLIGVNNRVYGKLMLRRISNPGGTPSISGNVTVTLPVSNGGTINVPHLGNTGGTAGNLDGLDYRLLAAHIRNGRLWTAENMAVDNTGSASGTDTRMGVRWYELNGIATGQTPAVVQSGTLFEASTSNTTTNRCYWMGSVMVSGQGHAAMGFSVAGATESANAGTCGRLANDPAGIMRTPQLYTTSSSAYNPRDGSGNPINRWGDYSYTCVDPDDDMTMWTIQEWCSSPNYFGVQIAKLLAPAPATPVSCNPSTVTNGASGVNVTLSGLSNGDTGFFDPGTGFSNRLAAAISGSGVTVNSILYNNPTNVTLNLTVAGGAPTGSRNVTVTNPDGQSVTSASGILTVAAAVVNTNHPPVLTAVSDKSVNEQQTLVFTNSATDPDGNTLTFSLDPGAPTNATINSITGVFSWTPTEAQGPSTNSITVRVTDNGSPALSATNTFTVVVNEVNAAPVLTAISPITVVEGALVVVTNTATDSDIPANGLTYSLTNAPANASINSSSGVFSWQTTEVDGPGTNTINVIVTDNGVPSLSATQTFTVIVLETNSAPILNAISNFVVFEGSLISFTNVASDSDIPANVLTYSLAGSPSNAVISSSSGVFSWQTTETDGPSTNQISVIVTDNGVPSLSATQTFSVIVLETNSAPVLNPINDLVVVEGALVSFTNSATDSDIPANTLTFSLANAPSNAVINSSSGVFSWPTTEADGPSTNKISVIVTDNGEPSLSATNTFTVVVLETNSAPTLDFIADRVVHAGSLIQFTNVARDSDLPANALRFSLQAGAPAGATVDATNGVFTWQTTDADAEITNSITVEVTDDGAPSLSVGRTFTATVLGRPIIQSIVISKDTVILSWSAIVGQGYRLQTNSSLEFPTWGDIGSDVIAGGLSASSTDALDGKSKFYRVRVLP